MRRGILAGWPVRAEMMEQPAVGEQAAVGEQSVVTVEEVRPVGPPPPMPPPMAPPEFPPEREVWPWLVSLLVLVLGGIAAVYFATRDDRKGARQPAVTQTVVETTRPALQRTTPVTTVSRKPAVPARVTVPGLVGLPAPTALARLQKVGLTGTTRGVFSTKPRNRVVSQKPGAARTLARGAAVTLNVSKGPKAAPVPDVVGQSAADALTTIRAQGFKGKLVRVPSDQPAGQVLAQHPKAGTKTQTASAIRLNVSDGRKTSTAPSVTPRTVRTTTTAPAPPPPATGSAAQSDSSVTVPDLEGKTLTEARELLRSLGLVIEIRRVPNSLPRDTIVAQARKPGTTLERGDHLLVTVSSGPERTSAQSITVPNVIGEDEGAATQDLESAGFVVRVLDQETTDPSQEGAVIDQTPAANQSTPARSTVTIYVGRYNGG
jgi:eukaryotic-like serine/threonine-protein kinase